MPFNNSRYFYPTFPYDVINSTPARYSLYDSIICGSISTPLIVNPANILARKAQKYAKSLKIQHFGTFSAHPISLMEALPRRNYTLTVDNGKEFASHESAAETLQIKVYFADPYSAWQRGSNENTNGLIRQYVPKGSEV